LDEKDHGKSIAWSDTKKTRSESKKRVPAKEMREKLTELGISIDGLKGKELTLKYNEVMDAKDSDTGSDTVSEKDESEGVTEIPSETPPSPQETHTVHEQEQEQEQVQDEEFKIEESVEIVVNSNGSETEIHRQELVPVDKVEEKVAQGEEDSDSESSDPAAGTGLVKIESSQLVPTTTAEFKKYFQDLGISTEGLRGKKAFKDKYDEYQKGKESAVDDGEETEDMSDDELEKDTSSFVEVDYEGVEYLEDEDTSNIYNAAHQLVGKWNEDGDEVIWSSDSFRVAHETMKD
jgi:hypothetical protein